MRFVKERIEPAFEPSGSQARRSRSSGRCTTTALVAKQPSAFSPERLRMPTVHRHRDLDVPTTLGEACRPSRTALVLYHLQDGILRQIAERDRVLSRAAALLRAARKAGVRVLFVRHVTLPVGLMGVAQMRMWLSWQRASAPTEVVSPFPPDAPQSQIVDEVAPAPARACWTS
jgi:hypothetical protein